MIKATARFEYKLQDMWVGIFWRGWYKAYLLDEDKPRPAGYIGDPYNFLHVWICVIPCLPLHITFSKEVSI